MASLKNWKRPSMDELPAPTEPYIHADRKRQRHYNTVLFVGAAFLGFTIAFAKVSGIVQFYGTPSFAYDNLPKNATKDGSKGSVVCYCKLNNSLDCDEHLLGQVSTCKGRYQLPIFCCTNVHS